MCHENTLSLKVISTKKLQIHISQYYWVLKDVAVFTKSGHKVILKNGSKMCLSIGQCGHHSVMGEWSGSGCHEQGYNSEAHSWPDFPCLFCHSIDIWHSCQDAVCLLVFVELLLILWTCAMIFAYHQAM